MFAFAHEAEVFLYKSPSQLGENPLVRQNAFCLWMKRLKKDPFTWPFTHEGDVLQLDSERSAYLLASLYFFKIPSNQRLFYGVVGKFIF
jgi:hypothetical protein